jgi:excisionase family DNA binding protein
VALNITAPSLVRIDDAAQMLGISRRSVYGLISAGALAAFKLNASTVIKSSDLCAYDDHRV